ncbi:chaperone protein DNAj, putative [Trypanosoma equiperdum]|uniref:Chaperone protein DNAJ, putative n=2 Tax=Trypanozoon TaxID=39700 RepID=Q4GZ96_TRYB2|nr:chaperone protein DNAJ, putative [Trypanosoma brucei brucei TREU927]CAJ16069.1 chaperone protein DNAJ, putative [Trypanosoma brucei brucei TREU927]SCU72010.1 chaperone protein DNAj, putative [Trypanosoma equiperdum]
MRGITLALAPPSLLFVPKIQRRCFNVIQRGNDREVDSLFALLGFAGDNEAHRIRRTRAELRQGFMREAMKLKDPQNDKSDAAKLEKLREAYQLLSNDRFRVQYAAHHYASPDASLHLLVDGGQVAANFNPEHQSFNFVDHAISRAAMSPSSRSSSDKQRSFSDFTGQYNSVIGNTGCSTDARPYNAPEARAAINGAGINFMLRISFDESVLGCTKTAVYEKNVSCQRCSGNGRMVLKRPRKCPQCRGRGSTHLPSATYHIERSCTYCNGDGVTPPPKCSGCRGAGVVPGHTVQVPVDIRPGTTNMTACRLRGMGHDGVRGGVAGDLIVTVLVQEHRVFHRDGLDLHMVLPITLSTALLGGMVSVPLLHGPFCTRVPPCVRNGQQIRLSGRGVTLDGSGVLTNAEEGIDTDSSASKQEQQQRGDLYIHLLVVIPKGEELTGAQRSALEQFVVEQDGNGAEGVDDITPTALKRRFRHWLPGT